MHIQRNSHVLADATSYYRRHVGFDSTVIDLLSSVSYLLFSCFSYVHAFIRSHFVKICILATPLINSFFPSYFRAFGWQLLQETIDIWTLLDLHRIHCSLASQSPCVIFLASQIATISIAFGFEIASIASTTLTTNCHSLKVDTRDVFLRASN